MGVHVDKNTITPNNPNNNYFYPTSIIEGVKRPFYNLFIADTKNHLVRMVSYHGVMINVAGCNKGSIDRYVGLYNITINGKINQFNKEYINF